MPRPLRFAKYHGLGNDFLVVDLRQEEIRVDPQLAMRLCDRRRGVGADGVLSVLPPKNGGAELRMEVHNADGSVPETCGNGLRCVSSFAAHRLEGFGRELVIETVAGLVTARILDGDARVSTVRVSMGRPRIEASEIPTAAPLPTSGLVSDEPLEVEGRTLRVTAVSMGNPHAVVFEGATPEEAQVFGPKVATHPAFPEGANAGFARLREGEIELVVWERGAGLTQACGTGACAAVVAARLTGRLESPMVRVHLPGGPLAIEVADDLSEVWLTGEARHVYDGELDLSEFDGRSG